MQENTGTGEVGVGGRAPCPAQQAIAGVLDAILLQHGRDNAKLLVQVAAHPALVPANAALQRGEPRDFARALLVPVDRLVDALLSQHGIPDAARFLFKEADLVEAHVRRLIERHEGRSCAADKTRTVVAALARHRVDGAPIVFDRTAQYTDHLPKRVLVTQEQILQLFSGLRHFHHGDPGPLTTAVKLIEEQAQAGGVAPP